MKRRTLAIVLVLALLLALPAVAAGSETDGAAETVSFGELDALVRSGSTLYKAYDELIAAADAVDRKIAYDDLVEAVNGLSDAAWAYQQLGETGIALVLEQRQEALRDQLDFYQPENYDRTYSDLVKPVRTLQNQLIMSAENLYLSIAGLEREMERGQIGLDDLERTVRETELLKSLGRASDLQCKQAQAARDLAREQLNVLLEKSRLWKTQLQSLIGETPTGALTLASLPEITDGQLASLQYEADLEAGMGESYELYLAQNDATDAKDTWQDASAGYQKNSALHSYNAAVGTYEAKQESFRQSFDAAYRAVGTARSSVTSAQIVCDLQQNVYDTAALRYQLGLLSKSAFLSAQSDLALAKLDLQSAQLGLVSAYGNYCWARLGLFSA
jgi:hypothetical protein